MRRTPLTRRTPLMARTGLDRGTGLRRTTTAAAGARAWAPAVPGPVKDALQQRSFGWCEAQLFGCQQGAVDPHHRLSRKAGGRHGEAAEAINQLSNLLHLCRACHQWITGNPRDAYDMGLMLREGEDPATTPVIYRTIPTLLDNTGGVNFMEVPHVG